MSAGAFWHGCDVHCGSPSRHDGIGACTDWQRKGRDFADALGTALRPAILDRDGATLDPAEFAQSRHKGVSPRTPARDIRAQEPDGRLLVRLLRTSREWPSCCAADQCDELASFQPIKLRVVTAGPGQDCRIATLRRSVSGYISRSAIG